MLEFILKRPRVTDSSSGYIHGETSPTTVDGLHSSDVVISASTLSVYIISAGEIAAHLMLGKIANWVSSGHQVTIYSLDNVPLQLTFLTIHDAKDGITIIEDGINNLP